MRLSSIAVAFLATALCAVVHGNLVVDDRKLQNATVAPEPSDAELTLGGANNKETAPKDTEPTPEETGGLFGGFDGISEKQKPAGGDPAVPEGGSDGIAENQEAPGTDPALPVTETTPTNDTGDALAAVPSPAEDPVVPGTKEETTPSSSAQDDPVPTGDDTGEGAGNESVPVPTGDNTGEGNTGSANPDKLPILESAPAAAPVEVPTRTNDIVPAPAAAPTEEDTVPAFEPPVAVPTGFEPEEAPVTAPTESRPLFTPYPTVFRKPTLRPASVYVPSFDDPVKAEDENMKYDPTTGTWFTNESTIEEIEHDKTVIIALSTVFGIMFLFSVFVAYQMLENPEGCCASICRITVACLCGILRCVCYPCRAMCGCTGAKGPTYAIPDDGQFTHDLELS